MNTEDMAMDMNHGLLEVVMRERKTAMGTLRLTSREGCAYVKLGDRVIVFTPDFHLGPVLYQAALKTLEAVEVTS